MQAWIARGRWPVAVACALGVTIAGFTVHARQAAETIAAEARMKTAGGVSATAPVTVTLKGLSSDADRTALMAALKKGGSADARLWLQKQKDLGTVQVGSRQTPIKYAYSRSTGGGRLITVVTSDPIAFIGAGLPEAKPKAGYDLGLVILETPASGAGKGELVPATKIRLNAEGAVVTEDYSGDVVTLANVTTKR
jgi:hypothetical protein